MKIQSVTRLSNTSKLTGHHLYKSAKQGSLSDARKLIADLFPDLSEFPHLKSHVCPVMKPSGNKIPFALAERLAQDSKLILNTDILLNHSAHGSSMVDRIYYSPEYSGIVKPVDYIICDDVYTSGQTLIAMKNYIESNGGNVIRIITIGSSKSTAFQPDRILLNKLNNKFPKIGKYFDPEGLTAPQIIYVLRFRSLQAIFDRYYESELKILYNF